MCVWTEKVGEEERERKREREKKPFNFFYIFQKFTHRLCAYVVAWMKILT